MVQAAQQERGELAARVEEVIDRYFDAIAGDLAEEAGLNPSTISKLRNGHTEEMAPRTASLIVNAVKERHGIQLSKDWLRTGEGGMLLSGQGNGEEEDLPSPVSEPEGMGGMIYIPLVTVRANGGEGEEPFEEEISRYIAYDVSQLRRAGIDPRRSIALPVSGSSMEPTLSPGDAAIVEKYAGEPIRDGVIYVFRRSVYGLLIKRVFWTGDGGLELRSDNPEGPAFEIEPGEEDEWRVIGRVVRVEKAL